WAAALGDARYDTVMAADVLEHLRDPLACLLRVRELLTDDGHLVVSVPNIAHSGVVASLLANDFSYRETGLLDRTHIHFFTALTLGRMLAEAGFTVDTVETVDTGPWHPEFSHYWDRLPPPVRDWLARNPAGRAYQIVMRARPSAQPAAFDDPAQAELPGWLASLPATAEADADAQVELEALRARGAELVHTVAAAQQERDQALAQLEAITSSQSCLLTAPVRRLARKLKPGT